MALNVDLGFRTSSCKMSTIVSVNIIPLPMSQTFSCRLGSKWEICARISGGTGEQKIKIAIVSVDDGRCLVLVSPVCQETVWEAFKIFWDRLPEQEEYQSWMNQCQEGTVTAQDIGSFFGQSEEHQALVKKVCE